MSDATKPAYTPSICGACGTGSAAHGNTICDPCRHAEADLPCIGCDCCASEDCEAFFCSDCPCHALGDEGGEPRG
jgi:hypothetical protein